MSEARRLLNAFRARPRDARLALLAGAALLKEGEEEAAVAVLTLGDEIDRRIRSLVHDPAAPAQLREASAIGDAAIRRWFTGQHARSVDRFESTEGAETPRVRASIWPLTHDGPVNFRTPLQQPVIFYMPDLPATETVPNDSLRGIAELEARWRDILGEYQSAIGRLDMKPYVPEGTREPKWRKLSGTQDWSSFHIYKEARPTERLSDFPATTEALDAVDLVRIDGVPMEAFFSRLRPGAHIPPHFGLTNTRLTTHLALTVPEDCAIRVGAGVYGWTEGNVIAFDDSYEHEAWNRSGEDRVVLIFEAHHPDLSPLERRGIEHVYAERQRWLDNRHRLLDSI